MIALPSTASAQSRPDGVADPQAQAQPAPAPTDTIAAPADAPADQSAEQAGDIVVTGIRASLERSIAIKRDSFGIVDAISAEDIGKFPDTNLAESLQRITGVSIDRANGQGTLVTVRGFGPQFNMVTLNGRTLATAFAQTVGGGQNGDFAAGGSRSFDFSNLASEGVKTLEVYKTGRAAIPSGGIGATINIVTRHPLDGNKTGFTGSLGAKAIYDTSASDCESCGSKATPEVDGLLSWSNEEQTFGISLFGSYQQRHFSTAQSSVSGWNIMTAAKLLDPGNGIVNGSTKITNAPSNPNELVGVPNDLGYHFSDNRESRLNGQAIIEFRPTDSLTVTADALYANSIQKENRSNTTNWYSRPFDAITFDNDKSVATTTYLHETISGVKDEDFQQTARGQKNVLQDYGLNAKWDVGSNFTLSADGHYSIASVMPDNRNGASSTMAGIGANVISSHSGDYSGSVPVQNVTVDDSGVHGNGNGVIDNGDVGTQVFGQVTSRQRQIVGEGRVDGSWRFGDSDSKFDFGGFYRQSKTNWRLYNLQQVLGNWGVANPGEIDQYAPGVLDQFCLACKFHTYDPRGQSPMPGFRGDAVSIYNALSPIYAGLPGGSVNVLGNSNTTVKEKVYGGYGQLTWKGDIAGHKAGLVVGVRYERTQENVASLQAIPTRITWTADNDFTVHASDDIQAVTGRGSYDNILPSMDFQIELKHNLIGRFSFSKTIARPSYGSLSTETSVGGPPRPTAIGGVPNASTGNPNLAPLISDNLDLSFEYYYKRDSYVSFGVFDKRVNNFTGTGITNGSLFGLRDPSSGAAGSRSGAAQAALKAMGADMSDVNLFTYAALIQRDGAAAAAQEFQQNYNAQTHTVGADFATQIINAVDLDGDANDPLYQFAISRPINNRAAEIYGFEVAAQHFFGNTGIGIAASFTYVNGDVNFDRASDPTVDQFALTGLSNTANGTLIYEKHGISARLSYNWRDKFLTSINGDSYRNPVYTAPFGQMDVNISYDITPNLALSLEGINLTNESLRTYGRSERQLWFAQEFQRRFQLGARYRF